MFRRALRVQNKGGITSSHAGIITLDKSEPVQELSSYIDGIEPIIPSESSSCAISEINSKYIYNKEPYTRPVRVGNSVVGGSNITYIAGPGYVESPSQMVAIGSALQRFGVTFIRARIIRPDAWRTEFQGLGVQGLQLIKATAERFSLNVVSEIHNEKSLPSMLKFCDVIEVGPRNSHKHDLLYELGRSPTTVILHRGPLMNLNDYLSAVRCLERGKKCKIILAENGIRAFDPRLKNMLDLSSIISFKQKTCYPVLVDCSATASDARYVESIALAAISASADGILTEVHPNPKHAYVETTRAITPKDFKTMINRLNAIKFTLNALKHEPSS
jgi:3-deoxy-7-phosphoheptulonate synthase